MRATLTLLYKEHTATVFSMDKLNQHLDVCGTTKSHYFLDTELHYHRIRLI